MNESSGFVLEESDALGVIEVRNGGDEARDAFRVVFRHVALEDPLLRPVLQPLVGKVDAELVERVGPARHVLRPGEVEEADEC